MTNKKDNTDVVDVESADEKLGPDLIEKISEKDWKTVPIPTEEELAQEKHKSPKARNNPNSRKNLVQYNKKKKKETKEKIVKGLTFKKKREEVDPFDYIKLTQERDIDTVSAFLPDRKVMKSAEEEKTFYKILNSYFHDFDMNELRSSDIEDIISLAVNRIVENRLMELSSSDPNVLIDVAATIQKFRQHSEKIKGHLASRRSDRIDPRNKQNFSIIDLVHGYDKKRKAELEEKLIQYGEEEEEYKKRRDIRLNSED